MRERGGCQESLSLLVALMLLIGSWLAGVCHSYGFGGG